MRRIVVAVALAALLLSFGPPAGAVVAVAGPGATLTTFTTPVVVVPQGQSATFVAADIEGHNLQSIENQQGVPDWCIGTREPGTCPLFWTPLVDVGGSSPIYGVEDLPQGIYDFYCQPHAWMLGTLVVV